MYLQLADAEVSAERLAPLRARYEEQLVRHLLTDADLPWTAQVFLDAGLTWLVMKGPVFSDRLWPRPDIRQYFDLDVLVGPDDFRRAIDALRAGGARLVDRNWPLIRQQQRADLSFELPQGTALDLHWHLINDPRIRHQLPLPVEAMMSRAVVGSMGSRRVPMFDPVDTVLSTALHAAHAGATRLVWLKDVACARVGSRCRSSRRTLSANTL